MRTDRRFFYAYTISSVIELFGVSERKTKPKYNPVQENSPEHIVWIAIHIASLDVRCSGNVYFARIWIERLQRCMHTSGFWSDEKIKQLLTQDITDGFDQHVA